ncbi:C45 family autoproteolytic acyltransferase/hydolase [Bhargavaea beijingensis]|uniref:Choloylglycine hydrolase n=1 Tax=Bhargavaea beijingensis TaxID=426756 RepID=A0ABX9ZFT1_9BACL|nr:C45 family peptidase [Bhargavaea beijingensis]MCW1928684.1 C45 family peptidase [Bhargavaea beijingensis]RSK36605.1 choloylglycine hydrolase [Bhargavaea beijingensis]
MNVTRAVRKIHLSGTPYEIGRAHGEQGKREIANSLSTYEALFRGYTGMSWKEACEKALLHHDAISAFRPDYLEEMQGVADGAGIRFEDILALNARSEIALTATPDGCTSFAQHKGGKTWLGQNWDWKSSQIDSLLDIEIEQEGKPSVRMITEGGIIGKVGCNSAGVGVCLNALMTRTWQPKVPIHLGLRAVLDSHTFGEASEAVSDGRMASPAHFLIASKSGEMAGTEVSPVHTATIPPKDGVVVHTNHICDPQMQEAVSDFPIPDSAPRLDRIKELMKELDEEASAEQMFGVLSDHENYPDSICRHINPSFPEHTQMETVFSIVMNLTTGSFDYRTGRACEAGAGSGSF